MRRRPPAHRSRTPLARARRRRFFPMIQALERRQLLTFSTIFDPDGGGADPAVNIAQLYWALGNALAQPTPGAPAFVPGSWTVGETFQFDYQAHLDYINLAPSQYQGSGTSYFPPGLGSTYEITMVASVTEVVTGTTSGSSDLSVSYKPARVQSSNSFMEVYFDPTPDANNLQGTGFNDGTLILAATPRTGPPYQNNIHIPIDSTGSPTIKPFADTGDYPGVNSVDAQGTILINGDVTYLDPAFFSTPIGQFNVYLESGLYAPFSMGTAPSALFAGLPGGQAPNVVPDVGATNGWSGPDFQLMTLGDSGFTPPAGSLSGQVYDDIGNDGIKGPGEPGAGGVTVTLTGTTDQGDTLTRTATTDAGGRYDFGGLESGTYTLTENPPPGSIIGQTTAGTLGGTVGRITITGITVANGDAGTGYDFGEDRPPRFTTTLPGDVAPDAATGPLALVSTASFDFAYQVGATDPDADPLHYTLRAGPSGMQFDPNRPGLLTWYPTASDTGDHQVMIQVDDGRGGTDVQEFTLRVADGPANRPPMFTSTDVVDAYVGVPYVYPVTAFDPDYDPLTFALAAGAPVGLTMPDTGPVYATVPDPNAGVLQWTPTVDQLGSHPVEVAVDDGHGHTVPRDFTIVVHPAPGNHPPRIINEPTTQLTVPAGDFQPGANTHAVFTVPGARGASVTVTFTYKEHETIFNDDIGFYKVLDGQGRVGNLLPGDPGYAQAAFAPGNDQVLFDTDTPVGTTKSVTLRAGDLIAYYLIQNDTTANFLAHNPGDDISLSPRAFFSFAAANPDYDQNDPSQKLDHLKAYPNPAQGPPVFGWEDLSNGQDEDYNDMEFTTDIALVPGAAEPLYTYRAVAVDPDNDPVTYTLLTATDNAGTALSNVAFDPTTGLLAWPAQPGTYHFAIQAQDNRGGVSLPKSWTLTVGDLSTGEIYGTVYRDRNGNGGRDLNESGLAGVTVFLDQNGNGILDSGETTTTTDLQGDYAFRDLAVPGTYTIAAVPPTGWTETSPVGGAYTVSFTGPQYVIGKDFGDQSPSDVEHNPVFVSQPPTTATVGQELRYEAQATDSDGDPLTYDLPVHPSGMAIDPATGTIVWTPTPDEVGPQYALLRVRDGRGGATLQPIPLTVDPADQPPRITSRALTRTQAGFTYQYQVRAVDPDNDPVTFQVVEVLDTATGQPITGTGPAFATDPSTPGLLTWPAAPLGTYHIVLTASDNRGGVSAPQPFDLIVASDPTGNDLTITSDYRASIPVGRTYQYRVTTTEDGQEALTYSLVSPPAGVTITADGLLTWTPTSDQVGAQSFQVIVSDHHNADAAQPIAITVTAQPSDQPPSITSSPTPWAVVGQAYSSTMTGSDPDHDPLVWSLPDAPAGMVIAPDTGVLIWTPTADELGPQRVRIQLDDGQGWSATLPVTTTVEGVNQPPIFTPTQPPDAVQDEAYSGFQVQALDPEGGAVTYTLVPGSDPAGLMINGTTGVLTWPDPTPAGSVGFTVQPEDDAGNTAVQPYTLTIDPAVSGPPPRLTSGSVPDGNTAAVYQYQATASDPTATFSLGSNTQGLWTISSTGRLQSVDFSSTPAPEPAGTYSVTIVASNAAGSSAMTIPITIQDDPPPALTIPDGTAYRGAPFTTAIQATAGLANDPLTYTITEPPTLPGVGPARGAATLGASSGRFTWTPDPSDPLGTYEVQVTATDQYGAATTGTFHLTLIAATPPSVQLVFASNPAAVGQPTRIQVAADDPVGITGVTLTVDGQAVPLDADGFGTVTETQVRTYAVQATATNAAGLTSTTTTPLKVIDPTRTSAPTATLDAPADQVTITALAPITGTVSDSALIDYTLSVAPLGSSTFTTFFTYYPNADHTPGTVQITEGTLGQFDPTMLADGAYDLRLTATNAGGYTATDDHIITVTGRLKLGNLHLSFTDLTIPLAGIPITITRTYDTLDAGRQGDFGYGWMLSEGDVHLQVSAPNGAFAAAGDQTPFQNGTHVEVTLPGQDPEGFTFDARPEVYGGLFASSSFFHPTFVPDAGVRDTLTVPDVVLMDNGDGTYAIVSSGLPYSPASFGDGTYTVTTRGGTAYVIDANTGALDTVTDRNGNTLTYAPDGITSSTGVRVAFHRDVLGRIDTITDPRGNAIVYAYDATTGDLATVTDRAGNATQFVYGATPHYLDHVIDPSGRTVAQVSYTTDNRVAGLTDAQGHTTNLSYDVSGRTETITPPAVDGNPSPSSTVAFDPLGNITATTDALGNTATATYDGPDLKTQTQVVNGQSLTTSYTYDPRTGLVQTMTDPDGNPTSFTYDAFGQPETITDGAGSTTVNQYDPSTGDLWSTTTPGGVTTASTYEPDGQVKSTTTPDGTTTYAYYTAGDTGGAPGALKSTTDPRGTTTTFTNDANGNPLTSGWTWVDPNDSSHTQDMLTRNIYDADDRLIQTLDPTGTSTETVYDANGRAVWTVAPHLPGQAAVGTHTIYDAAGHVIRTEQYHNVVITITNPDSAAPTSAMTAPDPSLFSVSSTVYDARGQAIWTDDAHQPGHAADGTFTQYDDDGRVTGTQRYANVAIEIGTDANGAAYSDLATTPPASALLSSTATVYDAAGRVQQTTDAAGHVTNFQYDAAGHQIEVDDAATVMQNGAFTTVPRATYATYDGAGRLATSTDALGHTTTFITTYSATGRVDQTIYADGTTATTTYDTTGRKASQTDPDGRVTTFQYDAYGDLSDVYLPAVTDPSNPSGPAVNPHYHYDYDTYGNLARVTDPLGHTTTYTSDAFGHRVSETLPMLDDGTTPTATWHYDALGQLDRAVDFDGHVIDTTYDDQGRVTATTEYADSAAEQAQQPTRTLTYTYDNYDANGRRYDTVTVSDTANPAANGTTTTSYDQEGRVVEIAAPQGDIQYADNPANGQRTAITTANTHIVYGYDDEGRLQTVTVDTLDGQTVSPALVTTDAYDPAGNRVETDLPNGTVETRGYDARNRLTAVVTTRGATVLAGFTYQLDAAGQRQIVTEANGRTVTYTYDADGRSTTAGQVMTDWSRPPCPAFAPRSPSPGERAVQRPAGARTSSANRSPSGAPPWF